MSLSAYVHIPFCARKCNYCAFYSAATSSVKTEKYVLALENQIRKSSSKGEKLTSVFFGGGTPSVLPPHLFNRLLKALFETFDLSGAEISTELNPDSVDNILDPSVFSKFNRFSMGVQSFDDEELSVLGRIHNADQAIKAFGKLRSAGANNVNIDLMIALPGENHFQKLERTLETAIKLSPEHISAYILTPEESTPLYEKYGYFNDDIAPDIYRYVCKRLAFAGYEHYEISNFSKKGYRCLHNMCYWTQQKYLAFGPTACGFDGSSRFRIDCSIDEFIEKNGLVEPLVEENLSFTDLEEEKTMLSLRLCDGIDKQTFDRMIADKQKKGFVENLLSSSLAYVNDKGGLSLTDDGFLVSNEIIRNLM